MHRGSERNQSNVSGGEDGRWRKSRRHNRRSRRAQNGIAFSHCGATAPQPPKNQQNVIALAKPTNSFTKAFVGLQTPFLSDLDRAFMEQSSPIITSKTDSSLHLSQSVMSTRRKPTNGQSTPLTSTMPAGTIRTTPAARSPFFPTRLETLLLSIYPATLLLGSILSTITPAFRNAPYNPVLQSYEPSTAPTFFATKKNIFNVWFVKKGWFWTTAAFFLFLYTWPGFGKGLSVRRIRATLRWSVVTLWWVFVTQWFFGPPLVDRSFVFTGGQCEKLADPEQREEMSDARVYLTASACKAAGRRWVGGHDISGHVFLLIAGSALLWFETLPALTRVEGLRDGRRIKLEDGKVASVGVEKDPEGEKYEPTRRGVPVPITIAAFMWWMLLMTAAFFHTWFEKFTGLLVAFAGLWTVYFLPRGVPQVRAVLGMPGV